MKCVACEAIHSADSDGFLAFPGGLTIGLTDAVLSPKNRNPSKRQVTVICRTPECVEVLVREMLGCTQGETGGLGPDHVALWKQALRIWASRQELEVRDPTTVDEPIETALVQKRGRQRRRNQRVSTSTRYAPGA